MPTIGSAPAGENTALDGTEKVPLTGNKWALVSRWLTYILSVLKIENVLTDETNAALVLAPDGVGGVEFRAEAGGGSGAFEDLTTTETDTSLVAAPDGAGGGSANPGFLNLWDFVYPTSSGWTWDNQGSGTIDSSSGYEYQYCPNKGSVQLQVRYRTPANTHFRIEVAFLYDMHVRATYGDGGLYFGFRDSGGKMIGFMDFCESGNYKEMIYKWNSSASVGSSPVGTGGATMSALHRPSFLCLEYDGTNINFYRGMDGIHWELYYTTTLTSFLASGTPDVCWGAYCNSSKVSVALLHWKETALP